MLRTCRRPLLGLALAGALAAAPPAAAADLPYRERPLDLPRAGASAASQATWLVGARSGKRAAAIAARHRARSAGPGRYVVARSRARALARDLRAAGLLRFAEADSTLRRQSAFDVRPDLWARAAVVPPPAALAPPAPRVPIGIVDDLVDLTHPDLAPSTRHLNTGAVAGPHGTMVASAAAAVAQGTGVMGVLPGNPILSWGVGETIRCSDAANGIGRVVAAGAKIVNLSFTSPTDCFSLFEAVQQAYRKGALVVAAAGNEFQSGNPVLYPAAYPHVLSVASVNLQMQASAFSNENIAVDLAAPGEGVPLATPVAFDRDGQPDGITLGDGTSFAAPIVSGAAAWLMASRPKLRNGQVADLLRHTARDIAPAGYDAGTGYGLLDLPAALSAPTPATDPHEPNDGISFVDGSVFGKVASAVWRGQGKRLVRATVDVVEDPVDVYRVVIPRRAAFSVLAYPRRGGDIDLAIYDRSATSLSSRPVARSRRGPGRTETARLVNRSKRSRTAYVAVIAQPRPHLDTAYRLELRRKKRR